MDVRDCRTVHRLPSSISRRFAERRPGSIGHITLRGKCAGARSAGKPHAACDVAGAGNGLTVRLVRHSHRKRGETDRPRLRSTAPALDPTDLKCVWPFSLLVSASFVLLAGGTFLANILPISGDLSPIDGALLFPGPDGPEGWIRRMRSKFL